MLSNILDVLGRGYTPVTYTETTSIYNTATQVWETITQDIIPSGCAGVDWEFVGALAVFALVLYCLFRLLGGVFRG